MKTYSEKLSDPRWLQFRQRVFLERGMACETCGDQDKPANDRNHVHHKLYHRDAEPWEYELHEVSVLCQECHEEIHNCEAKWRNLIRSLPSYVMTEFNSLVEELIHIDPQSAEGVVARAKNYARSVRYNGGNQYGW